MKLLKVLPLLLVASLTACSNEEYFEGSFYCFDTAISIKQKNTKGYPGLKTIAQVKDALEEIDQVADSFKKRDVISVYDLNRTNEKIEISKRLHNLLSFTMNEKTKAKHFNPFIGSLSNKWKEALAKNQVLSNDEIEAELAKMNSTNLTLSTLGNGYFAQRTGEGLIDLGAIAKGYALDRCQDLLSAYVPSKDYIVNAGNSSILLGTNTQKKKGVGEGEYVIKIKELSKETYLHYKNSFISTSGISEQKTVIGDKTYSHIIDPLTGSAISLYDAVIVITSVDEYENGSLGDALSTSFMMSTLDEIQEVEQSSNVEVIVIKDNDVLYKSESVKLY